MEKIWLRSYDPGTPRENLDYPAAKTIISLLDEIATRFAGKSALIYFGRRISYRELVDLSRRAAALLRNLDVKAGDRVVLHLPNVPQFVIAYLGILRLGAIAAPVNPLYHGADLERVLAKTRPKVIITLTKFVGKIFPATQQFPGLTMLAARAKEYLPFFKKIGFALFREKKDGHRLPDYLKNTPDFDRLLKKQTTMAKLPAITEDEERTVIIQCTGGVTGEPKPVRLSNRNLLANCTQIGRWLEVTFREGEEIVAAVTPFFHIYGLTNILNLGLISGSTIILIPDSRDIETILKAIKDYKATILPAVPWHFEKILQLDLKDLKPRFASVKLCVSGGTALAEETIKKFQEATGGRLRLIQGYGLTEASPTTHINPILGKHKPNSIGLPLPDTQVKVIDPETRLEVGPGIAGELYIKGPQITEGYFNDSEATKVVLDDGWLKTGDIVCYDEDGYFFPLDRVKDVIFVGNSGFKVYPTQVEAVVKEHPLVEDAVIVGKPLSDGGEMPVMFIVPKTTDQRVNVVKEVDEFCRSRLVHYKVPREITIVKMIPKTILDKPIRRFFRN